MNALLFIGVALLAYLSGGLNGAILFSHLLYHKDIRDYGSHNPGFTNFKRVFGATGWIVFLFDILKTAVPLLVGSLLFSHFLDMRQLGAAYAGFFAMLGTAFPVWYRFHGGKAVVACLATSFFVDWRAALIAFGIFFVLLMTVKLMSLSSMTFAVAFPVLLLLPIFRITPLYAECFVVLSSLLVILRHRANIVRLCKGEEKKFLLFGKKKAQISPANEEKKQS